MSDANAPLEPGEILPDEVNAMIARGDDFILLDVREPHEHQVRNIPQARLIPLGTLPAQIDTIDKTKQIVVHCKGGMRSTKACTLLREKGFQRVLNVKGGIDAWKV